MRINPTHRHTPTKSYAWGDLGVEYEVESLGAWLTKHDIDINDVQSITMLRPRWRRKETHAAVYVYGSDRAQAPTENIIDIRKDPPPLGN